MRDGHGRSQAGNEAGHRSMELLRRIKGKVVPTRAVIAGLALELDFDVSYLTKLAAEIKPWRVRLTAGWQFVLR
jgi:hypothetical protein